MVAALRAGESGYLGYRRSTWFHVVAAALGIVFVGTVKFLGGHMSVALWMCFGTVLVGAVGSVLYDLTER